MNSTSSTFQKRGVDYPMQQGLRTLPGRYYHDTDIYKEELEKVFYRYWILACRAEEIPNSGDFKCVQVGDESILVVRTRSGEIRAHFNVCSHRGTQLCTEDFGTFRSNVIKCPYHAWAYNLDGKLVSAPLLKDQEGFKKENFGLPEAHAHTWEGFVFISLAEAPEPFEVQMEALIGKFRDWRMGDLRIAHHIEYKLDCNWKLILQNYQECYHCPGVHPLLSRLTPFQSAQHDASKGAVIGGFMDLNKEGGSMTMDGEAAGPPVCEVSGNDLKRVYYYSLFPNMLLTPHPDFVMFHHIIPDGPERISNHCYWLFHPDVIADPDAKSGIESAVTFWDKTNLEDWQVCEQMQVGTKSRRFTRGHYVGQEDMLYALDQEVLRALGHESPE